MKYACPKHRDVILYEIDEKNNCLKMAPSKPDILTKMYVPHILPPKECPKCRRGYYQHECTPI